MKLHICVGQPSLAGFVNIDAAKHPVDLGKLDNICEAAECTEIIINDILKFMPYEKLPEVIHHISTKLRHKGKATLIFTDVNSVIREYNRGNVSEKTLNELLYNGARSCFSYEHMLNIIKAVRLTVKEISVSMEQVVLVIERP
jgi:hypothetical protein